MKRPVGEQWRAAEAAYDNMDQNALMDNVVLGIPAALVLKPSFCMGQYQISPQSNKHTTNNQFWALGAAVENGIISHQDPHRGFQKSLVCTSKVDSLIHLIYFKCS